ncbi:MAG: 3-hydroxyacyl-[acyl-carrier-protein] dehydratase [Planctomycetota bacterium]|jgi:3-hydroxyacyl-[acyl-carrier-protein] dehydratase
MQASSIPPSSSPEALVLERIPHRTPFLFIDRVLSEGDDKLTAEWSVPKDLFCFEGHYPGNPILPGVLIQEHTFQASALLIYGTEASSDAPGTPVLTKVESARFKNLVRPGDTLTTEVELIERVANARVCKAVVRSDAGVVARLQFVLALVSEAKA